MKLPAYVVCWSANLGPMGRTSNWDFVNEEELELVEWLMMETISCVSDFRCSFGSRNR